MSSISAVESLHPENIENTLELDTQDTHAQWVPPSYDGTNPPNLLYTRTISQNDTSSANFVRWAKWCPDGSTALAQCEDASLQYLDFPHEALSPAPDVAAMIAHRSKSLPQAAPVLDFAWYPRATCTDPMSFCFVASVRECPVKLLDAADGRLRASYRIVDHRERQIAPHSLTFNAISTKLYCGFEDAIEVFDVNCPGEGTRLHTTPSKKSKDGLKGIISSLAFSPDMSSGLYAAGSFGPSTPTSANIALFTEASGEVPVMYVGNEDARHGFGIRSSVSQLIFNPLRPYLLYASFRREDATYCWDIRGDVGRPINIYNRAAPQCGDSAEAQASQATIAPIRGTRAAATNQRLRFDIDISGSWLGVGDQEGKIAMFDLHSASETEAGFGSSSETNESAPTLKFKAHDDAVGSVGFHPLRPLVLSVSGSRHFDTASPAADSDDSDSSEYDTDEPRDPIPSRTFNSTSPSPRDATVKLWDFTHSP